MPEQNNPLAALKDIFLPSQIETGLPALGWWLISAFCLLILLLLVWFGWRYWALTSVRRAALRELNSSPDVDLVQLNLLMKRVALSYFPRPRVASLNGRDWLAFLDSTLSRAPGKFVALEKQWQQHLYRAEAPPLEPATRRLCEYWLKHVRPPLCLKTLLSGRASKALEKASQAKPRENRHV